MKKGIKFLAMGLGLLVTLIVAVIALPFLIDLNRFKPVIQKVVSEAVRAEVDFESARLRLFPSLGIKISGLKLENSDPVFKGTQLFSSETLIIQTEFWPLLEKKIVGEVVVDGPQIVFANRRVENNFGALAIPAGAEKASPAGGDANPSSPADETKTAQPKTKAENAADLEQLKNNFLIKKITISNAKLLKKSWFNDVFKDDTRIENLQILIANIGVNRDVQINIETQLDSKEQGNAVKGKVILETKLNVAVSNESGGPSLSRAEFQTHLSLQEVSIAAAQGMFEKAAGVPMDLRLKGLHTPAGITVDSLDFILANLNLKASAKIGATADKPLSLNWKLGSDDLSGLSQVLPKHKQFLTKASLQFEGSCVGPLSQWEIMKTKAELNAKLVGTDLNLNWNLSKLMPVQGQIKFKSQRLALAELMGASSQTPSGKVNETESNSGVKEPQNNAEGSADPAGSPADVKAAESKISSEPATTQEKKAGPAEDFALTDAQKALLKGVDLSFDGAVRELVYGDFPLKNMQVVMKVFGEKISLSQFSADGLGGNLNVSADVNLAPKPISFLANMVMKDVSSSTLVAMVSPENQNVLKAKLGLELGMRGAGTTLKTLSKTLNAKGAYTLRNAELNSESLVALTHAKLEEKIKTTSAVKAAEDIFAAAEKIVQNPLLKSIPNANIAQKLDIPKYRQDFDALKTLKFLEKGQVDKKIKDSGGALEIVDGRIKVTSSNEGQDGKLQFQGSVGIDSSLEGKAVFASSAALQSRLEKQSKYVSFLYNKEKKIVVPLLVSGTVQKPVVTPDFRELETSLSTNARQFAEVEIRKRAEEEVQKILKSGTDEAIRNAKDRVKTESKKWEDKAKKELERATGKDGPLKGLFGK